MRFICCALVLSHRWRRCSLPRALPWAVSVWKGVPLPSPNRRQGCRAASGLGNPRAGHNCRALWGKQLVRCQLSLPAQADALLPLGVLGRATGRVSCTWQRAMPARVFRWLWEHPRADGTHGARGCMCCMWRWAVAEVGRCPRAQPLQRVKFRLCSQCVPRECLGPGGVRPWEQGVQGPPSHHRTTPPTPCGGTLVLFLAHAPTPRWHSLFPSLCNVPWQTTEELSHPDTTRRAQLPPVIQWATSWGAPLTSAAREGSAAHQSERAPGGTPAAAWRGTGEDPHPAGVQPPCCYPPAPPWDPGGSL